MHGGGEEGGEGSLEVMGVVHKQQPWLQKRRWDRWWEQRQTGRNPKKGQPNKGGTTKCVLQATFCAFVSLFLDEKSRAF